MIELIEEWKKFAEGKADEAYDFFWLLKTQKSQKAVDRAAGEAHREVFGNISCTDCGNCCRVLRPVLDDEDIDRIAPRLGTTNEEFTAKYLRTDEDGAFEMAAVPCPFLDGNICEIYEIRPTECREFPHTDKKDFSSRKFLHSGNVTVCPAVFQILESMKARFGWRPRGRRYR